MQKTSLFLPSGMYKQLKDEKSDYLIFLYLWHILLQKEELE